MNKTQRTLNAVATRRQNGKQSENSALAYTVNWSAALQADTIATSTWDGDGATVASDSNTTTTATATLSGSPGRYEVVNKITTAGGETDERTFVLEIVGGDSSDYSG